MDTGVQFFSHLNGLNLANNWGDGIRLMDVCLVNGLALPSMTSATVDASGEVTVTFSNAHKVLAFQLVEFSGFEPLNFNQKYRVKSVVDATTLILKPRETELFGLGVTAMGSAKLASLGYEIIFRDGGDVKRVYRSKNADHRHPYIRMDETTTTDTGTYAATYAKSMMVGLLETMSHIDDFENPMVLQLPFFSDDVVKNWRITGTGATVVRGACKWFFAAQAGGGSAVYQEAATPVSGNRPFTLVGDSDAFYFMPTIGDINGAIQNRARRIYAAGIYKNVLDDSVVPPWFLFGGNVAHAANAIQSGVVASIPFYGISNENKFQVPAYIPLSRLSNSVLAQTITPDYLCGRTTMFNNTYPGALEIPFHEGQRLRGTLPHITYRGVNQAVMTTEPFIVDNSMYVADCFVQSWSQVFYPGVNYYLGEL